MNTRAKVCLTLGVSLLLAGLVWMAVPLHSARTRNYSGNCGSLFGRPTAPPLQLSFPFVVGPDGRTHAEIDHDPCPHRRSVAWTESGSLAGVGLALVLIGLIPRRSDSQVADGALTGV